MVNFNGTIYPNSTLISIENRAYKFGDGLFETIKCVNGLPLFWEDHYFRLMASMRILRMEIPMNFTMEFLQDEILKTLHANGLENKPARVRLTVDRGEGGNYMPLPMNINYSISAFLLESDIYSLFENSDCVVDLYKDFFVNESLLSTLKSASKLIYILGSIYAKENDLENCLLLNNSKNVVECLNGNIFLVEGNRIKTPPLSDGCLNGILRKQILKLLKNHDQFTIEEVSISTFELQKADELFYTNIIQGVVPITNYRKKQFQRTISSEVTMLINSTLKLNS